MRRSRAQKVRGGRQKRWRGVRSYPIHSREWCSECFRPNLKRPSDRRAELAEAEALARLEASDE